VTLNIKGFYDTQLNIILRLSKKGIGTVLVACVFFNSNRTCKWVFIQQMFRSRFDFSIKAVYQLKRLLRDSQVIESARDYLE